jgi:hypothetical protein
MPDARLTDLVAVRRWVADAAMTIILTEGRRRPSLVKRADDLLRCRDLQGRLQADPDQDIPVDVVFLHPIQQRAARKVKKLSRVRTVPIMGVECTLD